MLCVAKSPLSARLHQLVGENQVPMPIFTRFDLGYGEYSTLERRLLEDLDELLQLPSNEETYHWLIAVLDILSQILQADYEMKWENGYLEDVLEEFPWWVTEIQHLRCNHRTLLQQVQSIYEDLLFESEIAEAQDQFPFLVDWIERFASHRRHEREVVQWGFNLVLGGES